MIFDMTRKYESLAIEVGKTAREMFPAPPDWLWPGNPDYGDEGAWKFYFGVCAQMCGTGLRTDDDTLSCSEVWGTFIDDWNGERVFWNPAVSATRALSGFAGKSSEYRLSMRKAMLRETRYLCSLPGPFAALMMAKSTFAYGEDPFGKKLNLLRNALWCREDIVFDTLLPETGPVIDYHVMRVVARVAGRPDDEAGMRKFAYDFAEAAVGLTGCDHPSLDGLLWNLGRGRCVLEPSEDICEGCPLAHTCSGDLSVREPRVLTFRY